MRRAQFEPQVRLNLHLNGVHPSACTCHNSQSVHQAHAGARITLLLANELYLHETRLHDTLDVIGSTPRALERRVHKRQKV